MTKTTIYPLYRSALVFRWLVILWLAAGMLISPGSQQTAHAEGSRELLTNGGRRALTEFRNGTTCGYYRRTFLHVYAQAGETIHLGSSAMGVGNGDIWLYREGQISDSQIPTATLAGITPEFRCSTGGTGGGRGQLFTRAQELAGPLPNPGGYVPCTYTATETGAFWVAFIGPGGLFNNTDGTAGTIDAPNTTASQNSGVSAWDITVRDSAGNTQPGRVWTDYLAQITGCNGVDCRINSTVYVATHDGFIYRVDMRGLDPNGFIFYGNNVGYLNPDGVTPLYHNLVTDNNQLDNPQGGVMLSPATAWVFFEQPSPILIGSIIPIPQVPSLDNVGYTGSAGGVDSNFANGGDFTYTGNVGGITEIIISRDGVDFNPNNPQNRVLRSEQPAGTNLIHWDGLDNSGNPFPVQNNYPFKISLHAGELHLPFLDVENSALGGPTVTLLNPPGGSCPFSGNCRTAFYDDRGYRTTNGTVVGTVNVLLPGGTHPGPAAADFVNGFDTAGADRAFDNNFGNWRGLDLWTFFPSPTFESTLNVVPAPLDLSVTKTDFAATYGRNAPITYEIVVTNNGPSNVIGATVTDTIPAAILNPTWTCTAGSGASCTASGSGNINDVVNIPAGSSVTYIINGTISGTASGNLANTVTVSAPPSYIETNPANNSATDTDTLGTTSVDLAITKTENLADDRYTPGGTIIYTVEVSNTSASTNITGARVTDIFPSFITSASWTCNSNPDNNCTVAQGCSCTASGSGNINDTVNIRRSRRIVYTITATVSPFAIGDLTNTARVSVPSGFFDPDNSDNSASVTDTVYIDFGDLPAGFNDTLSNNAARHTIPSSGGVYLGASVLAETNGQTSSDSTSARDDDGINFPNGVTWTPGPNGGSVQVITSALCTSANPCYLSAWFDWNQDYSFDDPGETVLIDQVVYGTQTITFPIPAGTNLTGYFNSRFRLYRSSTGGAAQPNGLALNGEVEDYQWELHGGTSTPVTLASFRSQALHGAVRFEWSTVTETGNVGFNLYVETNGQLLPVNQQLIASKAVNSRSRQDYTYEAPVDGQTFYIEDVGVRGERRLHGPFELGQDYGSLAQSDPIDWQAIRAEQDGLKSALRKPGGDAVTAQAGLPLAVQVHLLVRQTGLYRVSYEMLKEAGLDLKGIPLRYIGLYQRGRAVPVRVEGKGAFGPGAYLEFYGQALDTLYTDTNVYTLQVRRSSARRVALDKRAPNLRDAPVSYYEETITVNRQREYADYAPGNDPWYDTSLLAFKNPASWDFPIELDGLVAGDSQPNLNLTVWGVTDWPLQPDHHLVVEVNGTRIAERMFDGAVEELFDITLPAGLLHDGENTLSLVLPGDSGVDWDMVNLDSYRLTYPRRFIARQGQLTFTAQGKRFKVDNLPSKDIVVYRLDQGRLTQLTKVIVTQNGGSYSATFAGLSRPATYLVFSKEALLAPTVRLAPLPANLDQPAQYLIISHPEFIDGLQPLVQARQAQGLTVSVVDVYDIYDQYNHAILDPAAIKEYIAYAAKNLGTQYVLLVGGDTYDYRNYLGLDSISFIPSLYTSISHAVKFAPADPLYVDLNDDRVPDLPIGRFPVRTEAELQAMIAKTLAYSQKDYRQTAFFAADKASRSASFMHISEAQAAQLPENWAIERGYLDLEGVAEVRSALMAAMNRGTALVAFSGHSGPDYWTFDNLFGLDQAQALVNIGRPFVVVQWGCWNAYYVDPANNTLAHRFLLLPDRGAAAVLGSVSLADADSEALLGARLTGRLAEPGMTIGMAIQQAKRELAATNPELADVLLGWVLLGDPTLVVEP